MPSGPQLEQKLTRMVEARGGLCLKLGSPSVRGIPDRLILMPKGRAYLVEAKGDGDRLRPEQVRMGPKLSARGFPMWVVRTFDEVEDFVRTIIDRDKR